MATNTKPEHLTVLVHCSFRMANRRLPQGRVHDLCYITQDNSPESCLLLEVNLVVVPLVTSFIHPVISLGHPVTSLIHPVTSLIQPVTSLIHAVISFVLLFTPCPHCVHTSFLLHSCCYVTMRHRLGWTTSTLPVTSHTTQMCWFSPVAVWVSL